MKRLLIAIGILTLVLLYIYRPMVDSLRGYFEITSYPLMKGDAEGEFFAANRSKYRIYPNEKRGIYWLPGAVESPKPLTDCVVRDRCNWNCAQMATNGEFVREIKFENCRETDDGFDGFFTHVSAYEWWRWSIK